MTGLGHSHFLGKQQMHLASLATPAEYLDEDEDYVDDVDDGKSVSKKSYNLLSRKAATVQT